MKGNLETVKELYAAFAKQDREALLRIMHTEIVWSQNEGFPGGGTYVGAPAVLTEVFAKFKTDWESWQAVVSEWLDAGDRIVVLGEYRGTCRGTGRSMTAAFAHVYTVVEGRVTRFQQFADTRKVAEAMTAG